MRPPKTRPDASPLTRYSEKRDFAKTSEPKARKARGRGDGFVVQKHSARRLHYDLRLELDGVLLSWAVTRGPSLVVGDKRLAVRTEDHPVKYLDFEGVIPKGEYGGGAMIVWDRGRWLPNFDARKGLAKGHLDFVLEGERLKGHWHLVRMQPRQGEKTESWLLLKAEDEYARPAGAGDILEETPQSLLTERTIEDLLAENDVRGDHAARAKIVKSRGRSLPDPLRLKGAKKGFLPVFIEPSLASLADTVPASDKWIHEIKYDGYRTQARHDGAKLQLLTRKGLDWTKRFPSVEKAILKLGLSSAWIDGEIVVEDAGGISSFAQLQADLSAGRQDRFLYYVFDILYCEGADLRAVPLLDRKKLLQEIVAGGPTPSVIRFAEHIAEHGQTMFEHACRLGLEGIVSKRRDLPYRAGRGDHWLKRKCVNSQELVIVGYVPSTTSKRSVGSIALGYYEGERLHYAGRAGTGFSAAGATRLATELEKQKGPKPAFAAPLAKEAEKGVRWVEPVFVAEIEFRGWTADGLVRQASFKGLREDKPPAEVRRESDVARPAPAKAAKSAGMHLTHPERVLWEGQGVTKQGLAEFYAEIADWILPHVAGRPLSLVRCPMGIGNKCFFAKHPWGGIDKAIKLIDLGKSEALLVIEDLDGLLALVQAGTVELHPWGSLATDAERPDRLIFDLDPGDGVPWAMTIEAANEVRQRLRDIGLVSFVKTSGGKGLHVVLPLTPDADWKRGKAFAKQVADGMAADAPKRYVAGMAKSIRQGRIFVDYLRNGRGSTAIAAYSTRARDGAAVSTPLEWAELSESIKADHFTVENLRRRLDYLGRDPWAEMAKLRQRLPG